MSRYLDSERSGHLLEQVGMVVVGQQRVVGLVVGNIVVELLLFDSSKTDDKILYR